LYPRLLLCLNENKVTKCDIDRLYLGVTLVRTKKLNNVLLNLSKTPVATLFPTVFAMSLIRWIDAASASASGGCYNTEGEKYNNALKFHGD
jgi:hypothetical protein